MRSPTQQTQGSQHVQGNGKASRAHGTPAGRGKKSGQSGKKARDLIGFTTLLWLCRLMACGDGRRTGRGNLVCLDGREGGPKQAGGDGYLGRGREPDGETAPDANVWRGRLGGVRNSHVMDSCHGVD